MIIQDWFDGAERMFRGNVRIGPYRFESDPTYPLTFQMVKDSGYVCLCGRGTVSHDGGPVVQLGQKQKASDWLDFLAHGTVLQKQGAAQALGWYHDKSALPAMMAAVKDTSSWRVRRDAAEALGRLGDASAEPVRVAALADENPIVSAVAMEAIATPACIPILLEAFKSENNDMRRAAVDGLANIKDPQSVEAILAALTDEDKDVRRRAVAALADSKEPRVLAALEETANKDTDSDVCKAAQDAVARAKR